MGRTAGRDDAVMPLAAAPKKGPYPFFACLVCLLAACGGTSPAVPEKASTSERVAAPRHLGAWTGKGSTTLGFVSESGSFRITWKTRSEKGAQAGDFELTLRSGISGRPLKVIAEHSGDGAGSVEFGDDPRMYEFLVESSGVEWSISVDETFAGVRPHDNF